MSTPACPHELRPGTTVCLHCAAATRRAARAHFHRTLGRVAAGAGAVATVGFAAAGGGPAVRRLTAVGAAMPARTAAGPIDVPRAADGPEPTADTYSVAQSPPVAAPNAAAAAAPTPTVVSYANAAPVPASLRPRVAEGRTALGGGVTAERRGDTVLVLFDTPRTRTRRPEKFEGTVRATLPAVYGPLADAALASVPRGALIDAADLAGATPRALRLALADGQALALRPETRPGRDGPLVVRYAVTPDVAPAPR